MSNIYIFLTGIQYVLYYSCKEFDMREWLTLGPVPYEEDCVQVNSDGEYLTAMSKEVRKFVQLLDNRFLNIPENAYFGVKRESHDFGTYMEAAVFWDTECEDSEKFSYFVESNLPANWTDDSKLDWNSTPVPAG